MRTFSHVSIENFLSLKKLNLEFHELNVLVGPNGSGKTNILKIFEFLGEVARRELAPAIEQVGGFDDLLFRGTSTKSTSAVSIEVKGAVTKHSSVNAPDEYKLKFSRSSRIRSRGTALPIDVYRRYEQLVFKRYRGPGRRITLTGGRVSVSNDDQSTTKAARPLAIQDEATGLGTLRRLSDAYGASEWNSFAEVVEDLRLFEINVDAVRRPSAADITPRLRADAANLASFLLWIADEDRDAYEAIQDDVRYVLPGFEAFDINFVGGSDQAVRLDIKETGLRGTTPLARASFGTIRAIALFAMLHDPNPPKLTCLEEIDHGLHPHALDRVVERLREASRRTQLILATHSPALVNRLNSSELIVVEREDDGSSRAFRPPEKMVKRLQDELGYELGELWFSGVLGGGL